MEDDTAIRQGIVDALRFNGFEPLEAADGDQGLKLSIELDYELLLLDLILPGSLADVAGLHILREVRSVRPTLPVIILTAMGDESDRVRGLQLGADDYVVKPFSVAELLARVRAVLRRTPERPTDIRELTLPDGRVDLDRCEVRFEDGQRSDLSEREVALLQYLARHGGRVITRQEILARVWQLDPQALSTRTIDMHVTRLREKLRDNPGDPHVIQTVRGKGYRFALEQGSPP